MNILWSLDCAFLFFQSYPCRLTFTELEFDLPCEEGVWVAKHPFNEPHFEAKRGFTLQDGFEVLFNERPDAQQSQAHPTFTVFDMFMLIHGKRGGEKSDALADIYQFCTHSYLFVSGLAYPFGATQASYQEKTSSSLASSEHCNDGASCG